MIRTMVPWRADANLGRAYNDEMERLPEGDWAVFLDHDAMPTTPTWHAQFAEAIAFRPDAGAFAVTANRIAAAWQRAGGDITNNDIAWHRRVGAERARKVRTLLDISATRGFGGVMFAVSKEAWRACGGFAEGLGCVDHSLHFGLQRIGRPVFLIEGLYVFHWRHWKEADPTAVYPKAPGCPCRGPELVPSVRIRLP